MPIFGRQKDRELIKSVNNELLKNILDTAVIIYKPFRSKTNTNLYGEGPNGQKHWRPGVTLYAGINREDQEWSTNDFGIDINQKATFSFLNEHIWAVRASGTNETDGFAVEIGDLIYYDSQYWEIDSTNRNQYLFGRNQNIADSENITDLGFTSVEEMHGESLSTIAQAHLTRRSKINIEAPDKITPSGDTGNTEEFHGLYR